MVHPSKLRDAIQQGTAPRRIVFVLWRMHFDAVKDKRFVMPLNKQRYQCITAHDFNKLFRFSISIVYLSANEPPSRSINALCNPAAVNHHIMKVVMKRIRKLGRWGGRYKVIRLLCDILLKCPFGNKIYDTVHHFGAKVDFLASRLT